MRLESTSGIVRILRILYALNRPRLVFETSRSGSPGISRNYKPEHRIQNFASAIFRPFRKQPNRRSSYRCNTRALLQPYPAASLQSRGGLSDGPPANATQNFYRLPTQRSNTLYQLRARPPRRGNRHPYFFNAPPSRSLISVITFLV